jgi:lipopolysaccharide/colanic/teichoic acid biosynthesis glycosyltransferase
MIQRVFDLIVAAIGLITLSPLLVVAAVLVAMSSPGGTFFRGQRVGKDGKLFQIIKFRTMVENAAQVGPGITTAGDVRITRVGQWLRRTKIDELPQLWNVVRGEMSLVGPRPEDPRYVALYTEDQRHILSVRPGITSPASIQFRREEALLPAGDMETYIKLLMPAKIKADLEYLDRRTFWSDLAVLLDTVLKLLY